MATFFLCHELFIFKNNMRGIFFKKLLRECQNVISEAIAQDSEVTKASYEICYVLCKHLKLFIYVEIVKGNFCTTFNIIFDKFDHRY